MAKKYVECLSTTPLYIYTLYVYWELSVHIRVPQENSHRLTDNVALEQEVPAIDITDWLAYVPSSHFIESKTMSLFSYMTGMQAGKVKFYSCR